MKTDLTTILKKYKGNELKPEISESIIKALEEAYVNVEKLNQSDIEAILNYQDEEGGFQITHDRVCDGETTAYLWYEPSYICTCILLKLIAKGKYKENPDGKVMKIALEFCASNNFSGHGYDGLEYSYKTVLRFLENGIIEYLAENKNSNSMSLLIKRYLNEAKNMVQSGKTTVGWGHNISLILDKIIGYAEKFDDKLK